MSHDYPVNSRLDRLDSLSKYLFRWMRNGGDLEPFEEEFRALQRVDRKYILEALRSELLMKDFPPQDELISRMLDNWDLMIGEIGDGIPLFLYELTEDRQRWMELVSKVDESELEDLMVLLYKYNGHWLIFDEYQLPVDKLAQQAFGMDVLQNQDRQRLQEYLDRIGVFPGLSEGMLDPRDMHMILGGPKFKELISHGGVEHWLKFHDKKTLDRIFNALDYEGKIAFNLIIAIYNQNPENLPSLADLQKLQNKDPNFKKNLKQIAERARISFKGLLDEDSSDDDEDEDDDWGQEYIKVSKSFQDKLLSLSEQLR